jgi:hypothetical protein
VTDTLSGAPASPLPRRATSPARPARPVRPAPPRPQGRPLRPLPPARARRPRAALRRLAVQPGFFVGVTLVTILFVVSAFAGSDDPPEPFATGPVELAGDPPDEAADLEQNDAVAPAAGPAVTSTGEFVRLPGTGALVGSGRLVTYRVEVETGVPVRPEDFVAEVDAALLDPRGWTAADGVSLQRTDADDVTLTVVLASPSTTDRLCRPLRTLGTYSCFSTDRAVINADRWLYGAASYAGDLTGYRTYVLNHEVGHGLGHRHRNCPSAGAPAPVMAQQTKGLSGCARNPWPAAG